MEYYSTLKKKEIVTHATRMKLESIMLSELARYKRTNIVGFHSHEVPREVKSIETK